MGVSSVLIIDAMCVVNNVTKTLEMTNAMHFQKNRIVFEQYVSNSLTKTTRDKRTAKQHRSTTMYMMVLKLGMASLFFPTSKQKQR